MSEPKLTPQKLVMLATDLDGTFFPTLMDEFRTSLIAEAVTGKIQVTP